MKDSSSNGSSGGKDILKELRKRSDLLTRLGINNLPAGGFNELLRLHRQMHEVQQFIAQEEAQDNAWAPYHRKMESGLYRIAPLGRHARSGSVEFGIPPLWRITKKERPRCGARTRKGTPCQAPALWGKNRCRMHGGLSTGAKTAEGRARIAESNRRRAQVRRAQSHTAAEAG